MSNLTFDPSYEIKQATSDAQVLYGNGKVREVFAIAATGAIATIGTVQNDTYIVMKKEKFDEILNTFAEKQDVNISFTEAKESEGINPQVGSEDATVQGE